MATKNEVLLTGEFGIVKTKGLYDVSLSRSGILYFPVSNGECRTKNFIQAGDIVGCRCNKASIDGKVQRYILLTVFAYPFRKKIFSRKRTRFRFVISFEIRTDSFESSRKVGENWKNVILCLVRGIPVTREDVVHCVLPPMKQMMVLINPHSGPGKALQIFRNYVEPMMQEADVPYAVMITKYAGHARDLIRDLDLSRWYSIVIVSGDGLIYEVINGLMSRPDWEKAIKMPVGCLPGGSGNALCCSINYSAGEPIDTDMVLHSTFVLLRHRVLPMDLVMIETSEQRLHSFLSLTWGIVADIDYESEKYRSLGEARFTVGAIKRIVNLRSYRGRLSFLPVTESMSEEEQHVKIKGLITKIRRFSLHSQMSSRTSVASTSSVSDASMAPHSRDSSQSSHLSPGEADHTHITPVIVHSYDKEQLSEGEETVPSAGNPQRKPVCLEPLGEVPSLEQDRETRGTHQVDGDCRSNGNDCDFNLNYSCHPEGHLDNLVTSQGSMENLPNGLSGSSHIHSLTPSGEVRDPLPQQNALSAHVKMGMGSPASDIDQWRNKVTRKRCGTLTATTATGEVEIEEEVLVATKKGGAPVPTPLLPPLDEPVPDDWVVVEDNFILACAVYQTHLGSDMLAAPQAHLNDGFMYLFFVRDGIPRNALLNLFLSFGEGSHVDSPYVEFIRVLAFRLEPLTASGNIMVDGERIDPCPLQGQILPGLARIMAIQ